MIVVNVYEFLRR